MSKVPRLRPALVSGVLACVLLFQASSSRSTLWPFPSSQPPLAPPAPAVLDRLPEAFGRLPLTFEANQGQVDEQVQFLARGRGYQLFLTRSEAVLALRGGDPTLTLPSPIKGEGSVSAPRPRAGGEGGGEGAVLRMKLLGANPSPSPSGLEPLPGIVNYFLGNDPAKWRKNIPTYAKVQYQAVYPGIDLVYYGTNQRQLEYDFVVAPGADPKQIALTFDGADQVVVDENGDLTLTLPSPSKGEGPPKSPRPADGERVGVRGRSSEGEGAVATEPSVLHLNKPIVYQVVDGQRRELDGRYVLRKDFEFRNAKFEVSPETQHLTPNTQAPTPDTRHLKPDTQVGFAVAVYDPTLPLIIDPVLTYSTYLGGTGSDQGNAIAVDGNGNVYVTGQTSSTNFPTKGTTCCFNPITGTFQTIPPVQASPGGGGDAFVSKFSSTGALIYSTYLGGSANDQGRGITVDGAGNSYVTGKTSSTNFPIGAATGTPAPFDTTYNDTGDAFVTKLNPAGTALVFSTYLGGSLADEGMAIAVEAGTTPRVFVAGVSNSSAFGPVSPSRFGPGGSSDAFAARLSADGTTLQWLTFVGGSHNDQATALALDASANVYLTGDTFSTAFPSDFPTITPFQAQYRGPIAVGGIVGDAFVVKLSDGGAPVYASFLGGSRFDSAEGIAVDALGQAIVVGKTSSLDFPTVNAFQALRRGRTDLFVTKVSASGSALIFSTYLGGSVDESNARVALDGLENIYVLGRTTSDDFSVTADAFRSQAFWFGDIVLAKLSPMGTGVLHGTYFGGSTNGDSPRGLAVDGGGAAYMTGNASSTDFPVAHPFQPLLSGNSDAFVTKLGAACGSGSADLQVTQTDAPDSFIYQQRGIVDLVYTVTVSNLGPSTATGVRLYDLFSEDVAFKSLSPSQGTCNTNTLTRLINCNVGSIAAGSAATLTLNVEVQGHPFLKNWAQAISAECDPNPTNNQEVETTTVTSVTPVSFTLTLTNVDVADPPFTSANRLGINCGTDCSEVYPSGAVIRLSVPLPTGGEAFVGFGGNRDCRDGILVMTGNRTCQAQYALDPPNGADFAGNFGAPVAVGSSLVLPFFDDMPNPSTTGSVDMGVSAAPPFSIDGPSSFHMETGQVLREVAPGVMIRFTPLETGPIVGNLQFSWSGPGANPAFASTVQFTALGTGTEGTVVLSVTKIGTGSGTVTGSGIDCGSDCLESYSSSPPAVTLTATADTGSTFVSWAGCNSVNGNQCQATAPRAVTATFNATGTLQLSMAAYSVNESGGNATITVTRTGGSSGAIGATLATSNGTATAGQDYTAVNQAVSFANGDTTPKTVNIPITNDSTFEGDETVTLTLTGASLGSSSTATLTIVDNDLPAVSIQATDPTATEAGLTTGTFTVSRTGNTAAALTVQFTVGGTATAGIDYQSLGTNVVIPIGQASTTLTVTPLQDTTIESNETVIVTLATNAAYNIGVPSNATVTLTSDDAAGILRFSTTVYSVNENGGNATITVTRTGGSAGVVGATVSTSNGSATAAADYTAVNQAVSFADGDTTSKTVNIPILDDGSYEGHETVALALGTVTGGATLGSPNAATLTILENDPAPPETFTLTVTTKGTGMGTVTSSPAGINCPAGCTSASTAYDQGTNITLVATPAPGSVFIGWGGACTGTGSCQFKLDKSREGKATFRALPVKKAKPSRTIPPSR